MKQLIILILSILAVAGAQAQCNAEYKPFKEYNNDTIAYLYNNFDKRSDCYKGKTIKDVIRDLELPILNYGWKFRGDYFATLYLHVMNVDRGKDNPLKDYYIGINVEKSLLADEVAKLNRIYPSGEWVPEHYELFKDLVVEGIGFNPYMKDLMKERQLWKYD